jgi:serine protease AprX
MINTQKFYKRLGRCLFLFNLLVPGLGYAAEPTREFTSTTNSTRMETTTESTAGYTVPPLGASHISPGKADSVSVGLTRVQRAAKKSSSEGIKSISNSTTAEASPANEREVSFSSGSFTPPAGLDPKMASELPVLMAARRNFVYGFILLKEQHGEQTEQELKALKVTLLGPHGKNLHKAKFPLSIGVIEGVTRLSSVEWVGYSTPDQKLDDDLKQMMGASATADQLPVVINLFEDDVNEAFKRQLETTGAIIGSYDPELRAYYAVASRATIEEIIRLDFVLFVEPARKTRVNHDESMPTISIDYIRPGAAGTSFDGASTTLGIMDSGFMMGDAAPVMHLDLNKFGCGANFTTDAADQWNDQNGHGTHVLGTIVGTGTANDRYRGVAIGVGEGAGNRIRAAKVFDSMGNGLTSWTESAMDFLSNEFDCDRESPRPQVINYSGGAAGTGQRGTDSTSRKLDTKVWDFRQLYVVCVGNNGPNAQTVWSPGVAKGALTVGNVLDFGFQTVGDISNTSSRGPTGDGRMKPNVVAPGNVITSARAGTTNQYINMTGCSMATPHVSGLAATLMQHYPEFQSQPYLLRSHLMASAMAHDNVTTPSDNSSGGRSDYGLGRVSAYVAHWAHFNPNGWSSRWAWGTVNRSKWLQYDIEVPSGTQRLVVVTTWDEPAASAGAKRAVTYDLDLWIDIDADCTPDAIGQCGEFASQSFVDNVEYLVINNPPAGTYRLKVIPWDAPTFDLPVGLAALIIEGNPAPRMSLAVTPSTRNPLVGSTFTVTTSVSNPSYVASGVQLGLTSLPAGLTLQGVQTTREDGVTMNFNAQQFTLGDIIESDTRSAIWTFRANTSGIKTIPFRAWSENGGIQRRTVNVSVQAVAPLVQGLR